MTGKKNSQSPFDPSRFVYEEPSKRVNGGGKTVRFPSGEASFSEQMAPIAPPRSHSNPHRAAARSHGQSRVSTNQLLAAFFLVVITVFACLAPSSESFNLSHLTSRYVGSSRILAGLWSPKNHVVSTPSVGAHAHAAFQTLSRDAALLARWGPVLRPDYALRADGARIVPSLTSSKPEQSRSRTPPSTIGPEVVIEEDLTIGRCWSMAVTGQVGLSTPALIYPQSVTIDHIPRQLSLAIGRAPRRMILWGVVDGLSNVRRFQSISAHAGHEASSNLLPAGRTAPPLTANHAFVALAAIEYDIGGESPIQTFPVFDHILTSRMDFGIFVLEVLDNWGGSETCLYRIRIHGEAAEIASQKEQ